MRTNPSQPGNRPGASHVPPSAPGHPFSGKMHPDYLNHPGHADHDPSLDINFKTNSMNSTTTDPSETRFFHETESQTRFFIFLSFNYPRFYPLWDKENRNCDPVEAMRGLSTGEQTIFRCLFSIWTGGRGEPVQFADITGIDPRSREPLIAWLKKPFFP